MKLKTFSLTITLVIILLSNISYTMQTNDEHDNPKESFFEATKNGDLETFRHCIENQLIDADPLGIPRFPNCIEYATRHSHIAQYFLENNNQDNQKTLLYHVAINGHYEPNELPRSKLYPTALAKQSCRRGIY